MISNLSDSDQWQLRAWRRGEMDADTALAFESRLFFEPDLLRAAQFDQAIEIGMREQHLMIPPRRFQRRRALELAAAATLGAVAVLPLALHAPDPAPSGASLDWVSVSARRSLGAEPMLVAPDPQAQLVAMELSVGLADGSVVAVTVHDDDGRLALQTDELTVQDGIVSFAFPRVALTNGVHSLQVRNASGRIAGEPLEIRYRRD